MLIISLKKSVSIILLFLFLGLPVLAATDDFITNGDVIVTGVAFNASSVNLIILSNSTAEEVSFDSGTFTVTNPGSSFKVASEDSDIKSIRATKDGETVACAQNSTPGASALTLPSASGTYTIEPLSTADCTSFCPSLSNAASYNAYPACGAASCNSGYTLSGSGAGATCAVSESSSGGGSVIQIGGGGSSVPTTYQTYNPLTGELSAREEKTSADTEVAEMKEVVESKPQEIIERTNPLNIDTIVDQTLAEARMPEIQNIVQAAKETMLKTKSQAEKEYNQKIITIASEAVDIAKADIKILKAKLDVKRDLTKESLSIKKYVEPLLKNVSGLLPKEQNALTNFIAYGTKTTNWLGEGERAGVVNSFKFAFNKLPETETEWNDAIKIANGRWPSQTSQKAEDRALINFKIIYKRLPNRSNPHDDAAITVMAYGLRPAQRNLESEKAAIKIFKAIYGYQPKKSTAWDAVRAIAYSGAVR